MSCKLRFPEFSGPLDVKTLGELVSISKGGKLSKAQVSDIGDTPCILYGQLYTHYAEVANEFFSFTSETDLTLSQAGDVIIPTSGETAEDIATATCITKNGVAYGGDLLILRTKNVDGRYLSYYINGPARRKIAAIAQGKTVVHLNAKNISQIHIQIPSKAEQERIASFLSLISTKIELSQQRVTKLNLLKKGLVQRIDSSNWDKIEIGEIFEITSGRTQKSKAGLFPLYGATGQIGFADNFDYDGEHLLIARVGSIGTVNLINGKFAASDNTLILKPKNKTHNPHFLHLILQNINWNNLASGTSQKVVAASKLKKLSIRICSADQQEHIGSFLSLIDNKINTHQKRASVLVRLKQALLQQMFV